MIPKSMPFLLNPTASKSLSYTDETLSTGYVYYYALVTILTSTSFPAAPESNSLPLSLQLQACGTSFSSWDEPLDLLLGTEQETMQDLGEF